MGPLPERARLSRYARRTLRAACPTLPDRARFNRLVRRPRDAIIACCLSSAERLGARTAPSQALDSSAGPVRHVQRRGSGWMAGLRQIVETVFQQLHAAFRLLRERPHDLGGFQARLAAKAALHHGCIWLHDQLGRPRLAFADLIDW